jgi:hypothetical protein
MISSNDLIEEITPARINLRQRKTKNPAATAAAIGKPTSETICKKSNSISVFPIFV